MIANSDYWKQPYQEAFNVSEQGVIITGMPRADHLVDPYYLTQAKARMYSRYPILKGKRLFYMHRLLEEIFIRVLKQLTLMLKQVLNASGRRIT